MGRLSALGLLLALLPTVAGATLLQNDALNAGSDGVPAGWRVEAWNKDLTDVAVEPSADGRTDGTKVVRIVNRGPNDARLCQSVSVTPGASYKLSARVRTEGVGQSTAGALLAIEPRIADSVDLKGTQSWQNVEVTASNAEHASWDMCLRLGSYANLNTGTAWFTDVRVEQIGGPAPANGGSGGARPSFNISLMPMLVAFRQATWAQTALPLFAGLLLAYGLGIGRRSR
jgi:hypothetical protein